MLVLLDCNSFRRSIRFWARRLLNGCSDSEYAGASREFCRTLVILFQRACISNVRFFFLPLKVTRHDAKFEEVKSRHSFFMIPPKTPNKD